MTDLRLRPLRASDLALCGSRTEAGTRRHNAAGRTNARTHANLLQSNRILADRFTSLLLAVLCGLEALGEPEAPVLVAALAGGHHPDTEQDQYPYATQNQVDGVEAGRIQDVLAAWLEKGEHVQDRLRNSCKPTD